ncbi:hypothetical protein Pmani_020123 [Petrolisthes manimaculis]|uniref:thiopurine S-methyltransferase n=1 Tax=Petrolisthes manimaculis TaxID=1843537 RepID=A0AAE1PJ25_9EUCA|nr:hypothetical protein Pmani_020123 [Petrolisthes manimaculis]
MEAKVKDRIASWSERWNTGNTGWHVAGVNHCLMEYGEALLPSGSRRRVFIPLCGKTVDLKWFYDGGHEVVGVEAVEKCVLEFFAENSLKYVTETLTWAKVFRTECNRLKIYCCDLMDVELEALGKFDAVWDRGSLVAIYEEDRKKYAALMKSLLTPDFKYLLSTLVYTPTESFNGPPRNVPTELVEELYGDVCKVEVLGSQEDEGRAKKWNLKFFTEYIYLLTPKTQ